MNTTLNKSNINATDLLTPVESTSLAVLSVVSQGPAQLFIISGVLGILASVSIFVTIAVSKKLHTKNYVLVACLAISDALFACALVVIGARRIWYFQTSTPMAVSRFRCLLEDGPRAFALSTINGLFCTCALDRFLAVATPKWYSMVYPKWLFVLIIIINYLRAAMEVGVLFYGINNDELIPICSYLMAADLDVLDAQNVRHKTLLVSIFVLFIATIVITFFRLRRAKREGGNVGENRKKMQIKVLRTLALMLTCYFFSIILNSFISVYTYTKPAVIQVKFGALCFTFQEICAISNFLILITQISDFRTEFAKLLKRNIAVNDRVFEPILNTHSPSLNLFGKIFSFSKRNRFTFGGNKPIQIVKNRLV